MPFPPLPLAAAPVYRLANRHVVAEFDASGLVSVGGIRVAESPVAVVIDGKRIVATRSEGASKKGDTLTFGYDADPAYRLDVVYELKPEWGFVSKRIRVVRGSPGRYTVENVESLAMAFPGEAKVRSAGGASAYLVESPGKNLFVAQQNPFPAADLKNGLRLGYAPAMPWDEKSGPFETDRILIGPWTRRDTNVAFPSVPE